jgi:acetyltransferase
VAKAQATPVFTCWLGEASAGAPRRRFAENGIPTYETPEEAVRAFMHIVRHRKNQDLLLETPSELAGKDTDTRAIRAVIDAARTASRTLLTEVEAKAVLAACHIPVAAPHVAANPAEAARIAAAIGGRIALKILSPDITHKSDVGGVRLDLDASAVEAAAGAMHRDVASRAPAAAIVGFTVASMIDRPHARELLLGVSHDATFGPVILFGQGGTATEVIAERAIGLPPLNSVLARELIERTRTARLLSGYRDRPPVRLGAVEETLIRLSRLAMEFPEIAELDINPLLADEDGVVALDARIVLGVPGAAVQSAIAPYPAPLIRHLDVDRIGKLTLRPIRPEDEPLLVDMLKSSEAEDVRLRFLSPMRKFPHALAARLAQIDYDREMAFVALREAADEGVPKLLGVARLIADPQNENAEFAVMVRSDLKGHGLGYILMNAIVAHARRRGIKAIVGEVLSENETMLRMARELGFDRRETVAPGIVEVRLNLVTAIPVDVV